MLYSNKHVFFQVIQNHVVFEQACEFKTMQNYVVFKQACVL